MKCGICHRNTIVKRVAPPSATLPCDAVHPMSTGSAPGTAPTRVDSGVRRFIGVYTIRYTRIVASARPAASQLARAASRSSPASESATVRLKADTLNAELAEPAEKPQEFSLRVPRFPRCAWFLHTLFSSDGDVGGVRLEPDFCRREPRPPAPQRQHQRRRQHQGAADNVEAVDQDVAAGQNSQ